MSGGIVVTYYIAVNSSGGQAQLQQAFRVLSDVDFLINIVTPLLNKASGFFRSSLSKTLDLRHTPTLSFIYDTTPNTGARIDDLLSKL